jgi:hypothetical protein
VLLIPVEICHPINNTGGKFATGVNDNNFGMKYFEMPLYIMKSLNPNRYI